MAKPMYTIEDAAQVARIAPQTLRMQFSRGVFAAGSHDKASAHPGDRHLFSINTVIAIAIANTLAKGGVSLARAAEIADMFAYTNSGSPMRRKAGTLYAQERPGMPIATMISIPMGSGKASIFPVASGDDPFELLTHIIGEDELGARLVNVDNIVDRVEKELDRK